MTRGQLVNLFAPALNEAAGTTEFPDVLDDIRAVENFLNGDEQTTLDLESEE